MQKVEGSSPFIRLTRKPRNRGAFFAPGAGSEEPDWAVGTTRGYPPSVNTIVVMKPPGGRGLSRCSAEMRVGSARRRSLESCSPDRRTLDCPGTPE